MPLLKIDIAHTTSGLASVILLSDHLIHRSVSPSGYSSYLLRQTQLLCFKIEHIHIASMHTYTGLFISPSGTSELDCATTKTDMAERSISIGRESPKVFFVLWALAYLQVLPLGGSRDEKWRAQ